MRYNYKTSKPAGKVSEQEKYSVNKCQLNHTTGSPPPD